MSLPATFWSKTARTDCIIWTGAVNNKGYPCFGVSGKSHLAHRLAWEDARGPIPEGMTVDHLCRVRNCVNVEHLELVTAAENNLRARIAAGFVIGGQCGAGHALTEETARRTKRGRLACRKCDADHRRAQAAREAIANGEVPPYVIREWALANGHPVSQRGRLGPRIKRLFYEAHAPRVG